MVDNKSAEGGAKGSHAHVPGLSWCHMSELVLMDVAVAACVGIQNCHVPEQQGNNNHDQEHATLANPLHAIHDGVVHSRNLLRWSGSVRALPQARVLLAHGPRL